jgi:hypothetical protein
MARSDAEAGSARDVAEIVDVNYLALQRAPMHFGLRELGHVEAIAH